MCACAYRNERASGDLALTLLYLTCELNMASRPRSRNIIESDSWPDHQQITGAAHVYTREMLAVSFVRLVSHLFLAVGREVHGESFLIAPCLVCGRCACAYLNGKMIASLHSICTSH